MKFKTRSTFNIRRIVPALNAAALVSIRKVGLGTSLVAQWIRRHAPNAAGWGSIPGQGTRSHMHAASKSSHATTKEPACRN